MPEQAQLIETLGRHVGTLDTVTYSPETAGFAVLDYTVGSGEKQMPVQLMLLECTDFDGSQIDEFQRSQMWDCQEERDSILEACKYRVVATDLMAGLLPAQRRAELDMDFVEALAELYPTCEAFYFRSCGKLLTAEQVRESEVEGLDRFIRFGMNVRFFNIADSDDMLVDTVGMSTLHLPDLQYHFHDMNPNWIVNHAFNVASYLLESDCEIRSGETIDGISDGEMDRETQWTCRYESALIQPVREVLDIEPGPFASGTRNEDEN